MRRKWTFRANGRLYVLVKRPEEREEHVLMKIFLAHLYGPHYPHLSIEVPYAPEPRYKPDLLALDDHGEALFWGECGAVSQKKITTLMQRYPRTHLCFSKWDTTTRAIESVINNAWSRRKRQPRAPVDLINFADHHRHQISRTGTVLLDWSEVTYQRWS
ncbi:MAG: hypothetical protein WA958_04705 [Tunicatimonas sp.]